MRVSVGWCSPQGVPLQREYTVATVATVSSGVPLGLRGIPPRAGESNSADPYEIVSGSVPALFSSWARL